MGMPPPLPMPPQAPGAQMGHQGGPPPQAYGTLGGQPSGAQDVAMGLASAMDKFVNSYFGTKDAQRAHYDKKATDALAKIQQGLWTESNTDFEEIQKWMKKAGWPVKTEAPTPEERQFSQQRKLQEQQQASMAQMAPQAGAPSGMQQLLTQARVGAPIPTPQAPPQAPPPGIMDRIKGGLGIGQPQPGAGSPTGEYLRQLSQASQMGAPMNPENIQRQGEMGQQGNRIQQLMMNMEEQTGIPLKQMGMQQQQQLLGVVKAAVAGDPRAIDMAIRSKVMNGVPLDEAASLVSHVLPPDTPPEEVYNAAAKMVLFNHIGIPMQKMQQEWAQKLAERFTQTPDPIGAARQYISETMAGKQPTVRPGLTMSELKTEVDSMDSLLKSYPDLPMSYANAWNTAKLVGDREAQNKISALIGKLPRDGTIKQQEFNRTHNLQEWSTKSDVAIKSNQLQLNTIDTALKAAGQEGAEIKMQLDSKDPDVRAHGFERLKNLDLKESMIKIPIPNPSDPSKPLLYQVKDPVQVVGSATGWLGKNLLGRDETHLAPISAPPVPGQMPPGQPPQQPSTPINPASVPPWARSNPYSIPDPFEGLAPELQEVLMMTSNPEFKRTGGDINAVQDWRARQKAKTTGR